MALSFDYGQKAFAQEAKAAGYFCQLLEVPHRIINLRDIFLWDQSSLTTDSKDVPTDAVDIESLKASQESAKSVWVANRNGVFLNIAACVAESLGASFIVPGFNREEAETFPDNSVEYIEKMTQCFQLSTSNKIRVECFTQNMDKIEIMQSALQLGISIEKIWPCYHAGSKLCGRCESCQRFDRARQKVLL